MRRRSLLSVATAATAGVASLSGCSLSNGDDGLPTTVTHVYVLNRRSREYAFDLEIEYGGDRVLDRSRSISGAASSSEPTGLTFTDLPDEAGRYRFEFRIEDGEWLRTTPTELNVSDAGADCVRVTFVVNLGDRVTAHAREPCVDG